MLRLWLVRHGETAWSATGRHTGRTDLELTPQGEREAERLRRRLGRQTFALVLTSPLRRARDTCRLAGYGADAIEDADLSEWDYGGYEGRTRDEIRDEKPGWTIWDGGVPGGETLAEIAARVDRVLASVVRTQGDIALFGHGHLLRILTARWLGLPAASGRWFALHPAALCVLGCEPDQRVVELWNDVSHLAGDA